jgi:hypothetical protein
MPGQVVAQLRGITPPDGKFAPGSMPHPVAAGDRRATK